MPENLLTDAKVKSVKPADRDWKLSDGGGLFLLAKTTGGRLWRWKYRLQGKENLFAIGSLPQVSLAEARAARENGRAFPCHLPLPKAGRWEWGKQWDKWGNCEFITPLIFMSFISFLVGHASPSRPVQCSGNGVVKHI